MKLLTTATLAALLAASIGVAGLVPTYAADNHNGAPAAADQPTADASAHPQWGGGPQRVGPQRGDRWARPGLGAALVRIGCGPRSGEALEIAYVRAKYELQLSSSQQGLLDAMRTAALADLQNMGNACLGARQPQATAGRPDLLDRLQARLAVETARTTALGDLVPRFKAFYGSLDADQKAALDAPGNAKPGFGFRRRFDQHPGFDRHPGFGFPPGFGRWHMQTPASPASAPQGPGFGRQDRGAGQWPTGDQPAHANHSAPIDAPDVGNAPATAAPSAPDVTTAPNPTQL